MDAALPSGTRIGRYEIKSKIGAGGMGEVYLAEDTALGRRVALKFLPDHLTCNTEYLSRFKQEARAASTLNHPNILTIHEIGQEKTVHFIATEFIDGVTLRRHMKDTQMKVVEVLDVAIQVAGALAAAHDAGIVHRDIKPENIMRRRDGYLKVLDFGLAKLTEPRDASSGAPTHTRTAPGLVMGTTPYLSPEQARGLDVDARSDIFSLGIVLYEMLAGRIPFEGTTEGEVVAAILQKTPQPLARFARDVPGELQRIVTKALAKDREERYQTVKDLLIDLRKLRQGLEFEAEQERSSESAGDTEPAMHVSTARTGIAPSVGEPARQPSGAERVASQMKRHGTWLLLAVATAGIAVVAVVYLAGGGGPAGTTIDSLAVLPFINASADSNADYLSDGITDSLINNLSQLPSLKVMSRNSVFRFRRGETDAQAAARELKVRAVLTGRVAQRGDNLSVSVELVDARDNSHLWGEQYHRKLADIFVVQEEIATEITAKLRLRLSGDEQKMLTKRYTDDTEAYQLYLKCNFFWNKFTPEAELTAIEYCTQAIAKDPNFALPYGGLVHGYQVSANNAWMRPHDAYPKAKAAIVKGLALDPNNPSLLTAVASTAMFYDWDWATAERGFRRANEVDPNYWHHHELYAYLLSAMGRADEAVAEAKRAQDIEPLSLIAHASASGVFYRARQYDRSMEQARKVLDLDPGFSVGHRELARILVQQRKYGEAIAEYRQTIALSGRTSQNLGELGNAYAVSGQRAEALTLLDELKTMSARGYVSPLDFAFIHTGLGDKERAFTHLEQAYQERSTWLMWIKVDPRLDVLRSDPRFAELLRRMRLAT